MTIGAIAIIAIGVMIGIIVTGMVGIATIVIAMMTATTTAIITTVKAPAALQMQSPEAHPPGFFMRTVLQVDSCSTCSRAP